EDLDEPEVREVAIEGGGRPLAGLLQWVRGKLEGDPARLANSIFDAKGQLQVVAIARDEIAPALRDADDRLFRLQLLARQAVVQVALEIERGHVRIGRVVKPRLAPQLSTLRLHRSPPSKRRRCQRRANSSLHSTEPPIAARDRSRRQPPGDRSPRP